MQNFEKEKMKRFAKNSQQQRKGDTTSAGFSPRLNAGMIPHAPLKGAKFAFFLVFSSLFFLCSFQNIFANDDAFEYILLSQEGDKIIARDGNSGETVRESSEAQEIIERALAQADATVLQDGRYEMLTTLEVPGSNVSPFIGEGATPAAEPHARLAIMSEGHGKYISLIRNRNRDNVNIINVAALGFGAFMEAQQSYDGGHGIILKDFQPVDEWSLTDQGSSVGSTDPVIFREPEREYPYHMYVHEQGGQDLYRSKDARKWEKVADNVIPAGGGTNFNWGRKGPDGRYYLYRTVEDKYTELWVGETLTELENKGKVLDEPDAGGYYNPDTDTWHMYYEGVEAKGSPCSKTIDHAVSDDGINWEKKGIAVDIRDREWKTGDPDVIRIGDTYHMFIDRTAPDHTKYKIAVAKSDNLNEQFRITQEPITDFYGGDACVRYVPEQERFVMYVEFYGDNQSGVGWGASQRITR